MDHDALTKAAVAREVITSQRARITELEAAIVSLNDALNELWGRDDCLEFAARIGARMLDKVMDAQNAAFALTSK